VYSGKVAARFAGVLRSAIDTGYVRVPVPHNIASVEALYHTLRVTLAYLRDHGENLYGKVRFRKRSDSVEVFTKERPEPLRILSATGEPVFLHSPPPQGQGEPRK